ncbi:uncharacterized protein LOC125777551 [Bactrocera dorsalis]|nr:uncharacterized protein LOC125777551 [Bactrocera dorsalis]
MSQNNLNFIVDPINDDIASSQTIYVMQPSPSTTTTSLDSATLSGIQSVIIDACQRAVEKVEEKNKLILLRLTENVEGMRKEIIDLKKAVSHNNATIIPSKPYANIEDFLNFEKTILEDIDKFSLLKADLKRWSTSNSRKFVTKAWQKIMTDNVAESFSWRGTADKKCIRAFTVATVIHQTFAEN